VRAEPGAAGSIVAILPFGTCLTINVDVSTVPAMVPSAAEAGKTANPVPPRRPPDSAPPG
jgi:hypothetical protein